MPSNRGLWLLLGLLAGVLIGYFLIPHTPPAPPSHKNTVALNILPAGIQIAPNAGDKVEWRIQGKIADDVHIHFYGERPCREGEDGHTCTITEAKGQFLYFCSDKADPSDPTAKILCLDPGIDPNSSGDGGGGKLQLPGESVVYAAQRSKAPESKAPPAKNEAMDALQVPPMNLAVICKNDTLQVLNPSTTPPNTNPPTVKVGGLIQWNSTLDPKINIDANKCGGDKIGDHPPACTVKLTGDIEYTIEVAKDKCANAGPTPFHLKANTPMKNCDF
jgi:hypothetical protein